MSVELEDENSNLHVIDNSSYARAVNYLEQHSGSLGPEVYEFVSREIRARVLSSQEEIAEIEVLVDSVVETERRGGF